MRKWGDGKGATKRRKIETIRAILARVAFFLKNEPIAPSFCLFSSFSHSNSNDKYINLKSKDFVLGIQAPGRSIVGANYSTELWRLPKRSILIH